MSQDEIWMSLSDASFKLKTDGYNVSVSKLSRMIKAGTIRAETDPIDNRVKLVEVKQLKQLFASSKRSVEKKL